MVRRLVFIALVAVLSVFVVRYWPNTSIGNSEKPNLEGTANFIESSMLDGMTFVGELGPEGKPKDVTDVFVFSNGTFVSKECELRCDYPARPYFISKLANGIEFVSNTKCPYKDAQITWHGTVSDGKIAGKAIWTMRRWYWTVTNTFEFSGTLDETTDHLASTN